MDRKLADWEAGKTPTLKIPAQVREDFNGLTLRVKILYFAHRFNFEHPSPFRWAKAIAAEPHSGLERVLVDLLRSGNTEADIGVFVDIANDLAITPGLSRDKELIDALENIPDKMERDRVYLMRARVEEVISDLK